MNDRLIQIYSFDNPVDANILKSRLESEGIECFLPDEQTVSTYMFLSTAVGNIKVMVKESDSERAKKIISEFKSGLTVEGEPAHDEPECMAETTCPECSSEDISCSVSNRRKAALSIILLGFPLFFPAKEYTCKNCGYNWADKPPFTVMVMRFVIYMLFISIMIMFLDAMLKLF